MSEINICPRTGLPHSYWPQGNCQYCGEVSPFLASTREERDRLREENERLRKALVGLTNAAAEVSKHGAQTGPQWVKLTVAVVGAKSALRSLSRATAEGREP